MIIFFMPRPPTGINFVDHVVGNVPDREMVPVADWYYVSFQCFKILLDFDGECFEEPRRS